MNKDNIIKNLNTISSIKQYQKFYDYNDILYIEYNDYLQFARRYLYGRNRYDSIKFIKNVFSNSFYIIDNLIKEYFCTDKNKNKLNENIMNFYNLYVKSIISLKEIEKTYKNDNKVLSELYLLKKEIDIKINKINNLNVKFINNIE